MTTIHCGSSSQSDRRTRDSGRQRPPATPVDGGVAFLPRSEPRAPLRSSPEPAWIPEKLPRAEWPIVNKRSFSEDLCHYPGTAGRIPQKPLQQPGVFNNRPIPLPESLGTTSMTSPASTRSPKICSRPSQAIPPEIRVGYAWASTSGQKLERQIDALTALALAHSLAGAGLSRSGLHGM